MPQVLQSILSGPLKFIIDSAYMWHVCTVSEREEGINIIKLIDEIDIGNYITICLLENKTKVKTSALCVGTGNNSVTWIK